MSVYVGEYLPVWIWQISPAVSLNTLLLNQLFDSLSDKICKNLLSSGYSDFRFVDKCIDFCAQIKVNSSYQIIMYSIIQLSGTGQCTCTLHRVIPMLLYQCFHHTHHGNNKKNYDAITFLNRIEAIVFTYCSIWFYFSMIHL